jgi:hypothetical protein
MIDSDMRYRMADVNAELAKIVAAQILPQSVPLRDAIHIYGLLDSRCTS